MLDLACLELPVVVRDGPGLGDHLGRQDFEIESRIGADRLDPHAVLGDQGERDSSFDAVADAAQ